MHIHKVSQVTCKIFCDQSWSLGQEIKRCWIQWENTGMQKYNLVMSFQAWCLLRILHKGTPPSPLSSLSFIPSPFPTLVQSREISLPSSCLGGIPLSPQVMVRCGLMQDTFAHHPSRVLACPHCPQSILRAPITPPSLQGRDCLLSCQCCLLEGKLVKDRDSVQVTPHLFVCFTECLLKGRALF